MSTQEKSEAEFWIESALMVLRYIPQDDLQLSDVTRAIGFYASGNYRIAALLARAVAKPSKRRVFPQEWPRPKSLEELERRFHDLRSKGGSSGY